MNCMSNNCKNIYYSCDGKYCCAITEQEVPDYNDLDNCKHFMKAKTCINCKHAIVEVFESDQIDCVDYRCSFVKCYLLTF